MTVVELLAKESPLRPAEIAARVGKRSASIRAYLARLVREGQVNRLADGRYTVAAGAADSRPEDAGTKPASPVPPAFAPSRGFPHTAWQRPVYWARAVWAEAFNAVLGELAGEVDQEIREKLFAEAMIFYLKLPAENHVLPPERALLLQSHALKQATELRLRLRPPRRRNELANELAWLLGDDAEPEPAQEEDELRARFRRICRQMEEQAVEILERALR